MSVPTRVLENGQWVTRFLDPYQILARNRAQQEEKPRPVFESPEAPSLAILTQTLIRSPVLKWICPARVRHETRNDVLFISEDAVQVKEAHRDYTLSHVTIKADFESPIRVARIFGLARESTKPDLSAIIKTEDEDYWLHDDNVVKKADEYLAESPEDDGNDVAARIESEHSRPDGENQAFMVDRFSSAYAAQSCHRHLPPQLLILVLESEKIVFLYATSGAAKHPDLVTSQTPLPHSPSRLYQLGEKIAVDPKSRAFAIAACEKTFYLYALKSRQKLERDLKMDPTIMPIEAERAFSVDGSIVNMEFLHPVRDDSDHVILLLIVSKSGKSKLMWYEWNTKIPLHDASLDPNVHLLPTEDRLPLLLIPLLAFNAFILVSETGISIYKDLLTGTPSRFIHELAHNEEAEELASSRNSPIWVQWARPMRSPSRRISDDNIYLCREDGIVRYIDIKYNLPQMLDSSHDAGNLDTNINASFAVIDLGPTAHDLLIAGGDSSEGGHWLFSAREAAEHLSSRPNWTPFIDSILTTASFKCNHLATRPKMTWRDALMSVHLLGCAGKAKHGSITELRYGNRASKSLDSVDLGVALTSSVLGIWALHPTQDELLILISYPTRSSLLRIKEGYDPELLDESMGVNLGLTTIAATSITNGTMVQVTETAVYGGSWPSLATRGQNWKFDFSSTGERVIIAATRQGEHHCTVALAVQRGQGFFLQLGLIGDNINSIREANLLRAHPTCVALYTSAARTLVIVGNVEGGIEFFVGAKDESLQNLPKVGDWQFTASYEICDSIAILDMNGGGDMLSAYLLVCGLRNGRIHTLRFANEISYLLAQVEQIAVGHTSVTATVDTIKRGRAIIHCDQMLHSLEYPLGSVSTAIGKLVPIWLDSPENAEAQQDGIFAYCQTFTSGGDNDPRSGTIVCLQRGLFHFIKIDDAGTQNIPRRWQLGGTPVRIVYSSHLKTLVSLSLEPTVVRPPQANGSRAKAGKRALRPAVTFLDIKTHKNSATNNLNDLKINQGLAAEVVGHRQVLNNKPGEKFLGITEWFPHHFVSQYHIFIFNTMIKDSQKAATGRLLFYAVTPAEDSTNRLIMKKAIDLPWPVYTVAPIPGEPAIMYCCGNELVVLSLDPAPPGFKFQPPIKATMRSPGRHLTINEELIYVSTVNESLQVYRRDRDSLSYCSGDTIARNGICNLPVYAHALVLAADMGGSVVGLWDPPGDRANNTLSTLFEAALPGAVTRLMHQGRPVWKRDVLVPGQGVFLEETAEGDSALPPINGMHDEHPSHLKDQRADSFLGTSTDGTITQLHIIKTGWRLLKFVQNMCERHPVTCPFAEKSKRHIEPRMDNPRFMHIDGEILKRLLDRGGANLLDAMLNMPVPGRDSEERFTDFDSVEDRWKRFTELAEEVFGEGLAGGQKDRKEVMVCEVVRWIGYLLRSAL